MEKERILPVLGMVLLKHFTNIISLKPHHNPVSLISSGRRGKQGLQEAITSNLSKFSEQVKKKPISQGKSTYSASSQNTILQTIQIKVSP
jgi:hypothetical protein